MRGLRLGAPGSKILTLIQHFVRHAGPYTMLPMLNLARKRSNLGLLCAEASDTLTVDAPPRGYMYLFIYKAAPRFFEQLSCFGHVKGTCTSRDAVVGKCVLRPHLHAACLLQRVDCMSGSRSGLTAVVQPRFFEQP